MHIVKIQELEKVTGRRSGQAIANSGASMAAHWKSVKCGHRRNTKCNVLAYLENCPAHQMNYRSNPVFGAFLNAYNTHEDIILSPDDLWMVVCLHFSKHVNDNAESLRDKFVSHSGKKKLTVTTEKETSESEWTEFFDLMRPAIAKNTKGDIVDLLQSDFSTTTLTERMISTACIMDAFKKYFDYGRCIPGCGIRNACFLGTRDDWSKLLDKCHQLSKCDQGDVWQKYIAGVRDIFVKLLDTYDGNVDVAWWNAIMDSKSGRLGSGSTTYYSGWILHLFGIYRSCESNDIPSYTIDVPVEIDNRETGAKKTVHLVGGFGRGLHVVSVDHRKAYRPQMSMVVLHTLDAPKET